MFEIKEDNLEIFIEKINSILEEAIKHGGDYGGAYFINSENLQHAITDFLRWTGLEEEVQLYNSNIPKLIQKNKLVN